MLTGLETAYMNHSRYSLYARLCTDVCVTASASISENLFKRESRRMEERTGEKKHYS